MATKNKKQQSKFILRTVAVVMALVVLFGAAWCIGRLITGTWDMREWGAKQPAENGGLVVTPENPSSASAMRIQKYALTDEEEPADNEELIEVVTPFYFGNYNWAVEFTGDVVYWSDSDDDVVYDIEIGLRRPTADECVTVEKMPNLENVYKVTCLKAFGQQIKLTASRADKPELNASCICDYTQRYNFGSLSLGRDSILADGTIIGSGRNVAGTFTVPVTTGEQSLSYSVNYVSTAYTKTAPAPTTCEGLGFSLDVSSDWVSEFGLEDYNFKTYSGSLSLKLSGTVSNYFDINWLEYCVDGSGKTVYDFALKLTTATTQKSVNGPNGTEIYEIGADGLPAYTLTVSGLPETDGEYTYDVYLDLSELVDYVGDNSAPQLSTSHIDF